MYKRLTPNLTALIDVLMIVLFSFQLNLETVSENIMTEAEKEATKLETKITELEVELAISKEKSDMAVLFEDEPKDTLKNMQADLAAAKEVLARTMKEKTDQQEEVEKLETEIEEVTQDYEAKITELENSLKASETLVKTHEASITELQTEITEAKEREKEQKNKIIELEADITTLEMQVAYKQDQIENLETTLATFREQRKVNEAKITELESELSTAQSTLEEALDTQEEQRNEIETLEAVIKGLEEEANTGSGNGGRILLDLEHVTICNNLNYTVNIVIAYVNNRWITEGWRTIDPDKCSNITLYNNSTNHFSYFAIKAGRSPSTGDNTIGRGYCINERDFLYPNDSVTDVRDKDKCPRHLFSGNYYVSMHSKTGTNGSATVYLN